MKQSLWNMFSNLNNSQKANKAFTIQPNKKSCSLLLNVLWDEGFIIGYKISNNQLKIFLKYKNGKPAINSLKPISKPGHRIYYSTKQLWKIQYEIGTIVLSTNKGFLSLNECKRQNIGGEPFLIIK